MKRSNSKKRQYSCDSVHFTSCFKSLRKGRGPTLRKDDSCDSMHFTSCFKSLRQGRGPNLRKDDSCDSTGTSAIYHKLPVFIHGSRLTELIYRRVQIPQTLCNQRTLEVIQYI